MVDEVRNDDTDFLAVLMAIKDMQAMTMTTLMANNMNISDSIFQKLCHILFILNIKNAKFDEYESL